MSRKRPLLQSMNEGEDPIFLNVTVLLDSRDAFDVQGIVMDFIVALWLPYRQAFRFEPDAIAETLAKVVPGRGYTAEMLRCKEAQLREFFTVLPDGRWAPNPKYFAVNDPQRESH